MNFSSTGLDPLIGTEIMDLLSIPDHYLSNPKKFAQLKEVVDFFQTVPNYRYQILKMTGNVYGEKLDKAWNYVQLKKVKQKVIEQLNPKDFENDIAKEIVDGHITIPKLERIEVDIDAKLKERAKEIRQETYNEKKKIALTEQVEKLSKTKKTVDEYKQINKVLEQYE